MGWAVLVREEEEATARAMGGSVEAAMVEVAVTAPAALEMAEVVGLEALAVAWAAREAAKVVAMEVAMVAATVTVWATGMVAEDRAVGEWAEVAKEGVVVAADGIGGEGGGGVGGGGSGVGGGGDGGGGDGAGGDGGRGGEGARQVSGAPAAVSAALNAWTAIRSAPIRQVRQLMVACSCS